MTPTERIAMYELAMRDIRGIRRLVNGTWEDMLSAARCIADCALAGKYQGWKALEDDRMGDNE